MFTRCNILDAELEWVSAHDGDGLIQARRLAQSADFDGPCNFIDIAHVPAGSSIGMHRHREEEEEFYLILDGQGLMTLDADQFRVKKGDLIRNRPGGRHALCNDGTAPLIIFIFELGIQIERSVGA